MNAMNNTLLILGAGSAMPYGFPSGMELRHTLISLDKSHMDNMRQTLSKALNSAPHPLQMPSSDVLRKMSSDLVKLDEIHSMIRNSDYFKLQGATEDQTWGEISAFSNAFKYSGLRSIDSFLSYRSEYEKIGKIAIAAAILHYENKCLLEEWDWYGELWSRLAKYITSNEGSWTVDGPPLKIITFNYDRSLEFFLWKALQSTYGLDDDLSFQLMSQFGILHFYGSLGPLHGENSIPFGDFSIGNSHENLMVIPYERESLVEADESVDQTQAKSLIKSRDYSLVYMGFGFDARNCELLGLSSETNGLGIHGTTIGLTAYERKGIAKKYFGISGGSAAEDFSKEEYDCMELIRNKPIFGF
jgi:hypothetical protein